MNSSESRQVTMLHTKFQGHRSIGSGVEDFKGFTIYGRGDHIGQVVRPGRFVHIFVHSAPEIKITGGPVAFQMFENIIL